MNLSQVTAKYIGQPYRAYGCLEFCYRFLVDLGFDPPQMVGDWSMDNYGELVAADIRRAQAVMLRSFWQIGTPADTRYPRIGNVLAVLQTGPALFPAVYVGGGNAIASFIRRGVAVFPLGPENRAVIARRIS